MIWADYHQFRKSTHFSRFLSHSFPGTVHHLKKSWHTQSQVASKRQGSEYVLATMQIFMRQASLEYQQQYRWHRFWWGILLLQSTGNYADSTDFDEEYLFFRILATMLICRYFDEEYWFENWVAPPCAVDGNWRDCWQDNYWATVGT